MGGIYRGSYIITLCTSSGGTKIPDICKIVGGRGISSDLWLVYSLLTKDTYRVRAIDIASKSYYYNHSAGAELIYQTITGQNPEYPKT